MNKNTTRLARAFRAADAAAVALHDAEAHAMACQARAEEARELYRAARRDEQRTRRAYQRAGERAADAVFEAFRAA